MPRIVFTANLQRHLPCPTLQAEGGTVAELLERVFVDRPQLRSYLLDDQGRVRRHVAIYRNGLPIQDRVRLSDPVAAQDEIHVFQALSGG
jgi:molybdopterin converting factor small subunit